MIITRYKRPINQYESNRFRGLDLFNEFLNTLDTHSEPTQNIVDFNPTVNTREAEDEYYIEVDLPGIKKEDVDVKVEDNILTISGKRKLKNEVKEDDYYKIESSYGSFSRSFTLPEKVDIENIKASSEDGVLEVIIPKLKVTKDSVKKIKIK